MTRTQKEVAAPHKARAWAVRPQGWEGPPLIYRFRQPVCASTARKEARRHFTARPLAIEKKED